jgi:hypothetical protein
MLTLIVLAHAILRWWVQRRSHQADPLDDTSTDIRFRWWSGHGLIALLPALVLVIWVHGLYLTATLLLHESGLRGLANPALVVLTWTHRIGLVGAIFWLLSRLGRLIDTSLQSLAARAETSWDDVVLPLAGKAIRRGLPLLALILGAPIMSVSPALDQAMRTSTSLAVISFVALILFQIVDATTTFIQREHRIDVSDNLSARSVYTQVLVLKKVAVTTIGIFALASMLMVFELDPTVWREYSRDGRHRWHRGWFRCSAQYWDVACRTPNRPDSQAIGRPCHVLY